MKWFLSFVIIVAEGISSRRFVLLVCSSSPSHLSAFSSDAKCKVRGNTSLPKGYVSLLQSGKLRQRLQCFSSSCREGAAEGSSLQTWQREDWGGRLGLGCTAAEDGGRGDLAVALPATGRMRNRAKASGAVGGRQLLLAGREWLSAPTAVAAVDGLETDAGLLAVDMDGAHRGSRHRPPCAAEVKE